MSPTITFGGFLSTSLKLSSSWLAIRARVFESQGKQQLLMGVSLCTGSICEVGVLDYNAGWRVRCGRSSTFAVI